MTNEEVAARAQAIADEVLAWDMADWSGWSEVDTLAVRILSLNILNERHQGGPQLRALELFRSWLTPKERRDLSRNGGVVVVGTLGGRYRLYPATGTTWMLERHRTKWFGMTRLCFHPMIWVPPADVSLAHYLGIQTDEAAFLAGANQHPNGNPWERGARLRQRRVQAA